MKSRAAAPLHTLRSHLTCSWNTLGAATLAKTAAPAYREQQNSPSLVPSEVRPETSFRPVFIASVTAMFGVQRV